MSDLSFRILGPLEVFVDGHPAALGGVKQRALLAALLLRANTAVSTEELIDLVWSEDPPPNARAAIHVYLSRLRRLLATSDHEAPLVRRTAGYQLAVAPEQLDADSFDLLADEGRVAFASGDATRAEIWFTKALDLWRGSALADLAKEQAFAADRHRLDEARVRVFEERVDARLALGRPQDTIPDLQRLIQTYPYRERLRVQLMRSLWACGRQADALEAFRAARTTLTTELGLEPGKELRQVQHAILTQMETEPRPPSVENSSIEDPSDSGAADFLRRYQRRWWIAGTLVLAIAVVAGALLAWLQVRETTGSRTSALISISPSSLRVLGSVPAADASALAVTRRQAWLGLNQERIVMKVDLANQRVTERIGLPIRPDALAAGNGVWAVTAGDAEVGYVANAVVTRVDDPTSARPTMYSIPGTGGGAPVIAATQGAVWVGNDDDARIARFDTATRKVSITVRGVTPRVLVTGRDVLWAVEALDDTVTQMDSKSGRILGSLEIDLQAPSAGVEAADALWVTDRAAGLVWRINAAAHLAARTIEVGRGPTAIAAGGGFIWIANTLDGTISKLDPTRDEVVATQGLDGYPIALGWSQNRLWVLTRATVS